LIAKPAGTSDSDWKTQTASTFPAYHSTIALDDAISKKDFRAAVAEYKADLMLYTDEQTKTVGLSDTLQLAQAYSEQEKVDAKLVLEADAKVRTASDPDAKAQAVKAAKDAKDQDAADLLQAIWFYARAFDFAPANYKAKIEPSLNYSYKKYHGDLKGLDDIKTQAAATTFPPGTLVIAQAKTPAEQIHDLLATTPNWGSLALEDKETVLAVGSKDDADKLWATLQGQPTPVPGIVIEATASVIKVAVTKDAKDAKTADFIVNMKEPLADKDVPEVGSEFKLMKDGGPELDGTYDTYTQVPATTTTTQAASIVLKDGFIQAKKVVKPVAHKPAAGHKAAAH
jgi:hypothetical protein